MPLVCVSATCLDASVITHKAARLVGNFAFFAELCDSVDDVALGFIGVSMGGVITFI